MSTKLRLCAVATVFVLIFAGSARATTNIYWGYNNLTASNPPAGTCPGWYSGVACSGWGNWDYSQVDWTSGEARFVFGFVCQSDGLLHYDRVYGDGDQKTTYTIFYARLCPGQYNKAGVAHYDNYGGHTYNYLQARALVF